MSTSGTSNFVPTALFPRLPFDVVTMAASAGGIVALKQIFDHLPASFPVPITVVQHVSALWPSRLPDVLGWNSRLQVGFARHRERLRAGRVYVAPPDQHLEFGEDGRLELQSTARCNFVRPAADQLFRSAASAFGARVLCVVLTGMGFDGATGAAALKSRGSMVVVQDPLDASAPDMPRATIQACAVDLTLPLKAIAVALQALTSVRGARELFTSGSGRLCA